MKNLTRWVVAIALTTTSMFYSCGDTVENQSVTIQIETEKSWVGTECQIDVVCISYSKGGTPLWFNKRCIPSSGYKCGINESQICVPTIITCFWDESMWIDPGIGRSILIN